MTSARLIRFKTLLEPALIAALALTTAVACNGSVSFETSKDADSGPLGSVRLEAGESIHVRSMTSLTGVASLGVPERRGFEMAIADYGDIHGRAVSPGAGLDSQCSSVGGRLAAETAAGDPRVAGAMGTSCSVAGSAAAPVISEAGLVMVSPSNTAPSLTSDLAGNAGSNQRAGYYRLSNNDLHQAGAVARFAYEELGLRSVGAIHDGDPYSEGLVSAFEDAFGELGGETEIASIEKGQTDMGPVLSQLAAQSPDGLFFPLFPAEGAHVIGQVAGVAGLEGATLIGGAALLEPDTLALPESEGMYLPGPEQDFGDQVNEATGKSGAQLIADYREMYGEEPSTAYLAHAYDATTILLRAIEEVAVVDGDTLVIDREELRQALTATAGFEGIIGTISCGEFGDCGTGRVNIYHHTDASVTVVSEVPVVYRFAP